MTLHLTETFQWRVEYVSTLFEDSDRFWQWLHRRDKKLYRPAAIRTWAIVIYESQGRFRQDTARDMARGFIEGALSVGKYILYIRFFFAAKLINFTQEWLCPILNRWSSGRTGKETLEMYVFFFFSCYIQDADVTLLTFPQHMRKAGKACLDQKGSPPNLIVVVLPEGGNEIYSAVKKWAIYFTFGLYFFSLMFILSFSFGDVQVGTVTFFLYLLKWCIDGRRYSMLEVEQM